MNGARNTGERAMRRAVVTAMATVALCLPSSSIGQKQEHSRPAREQQAPRYSAPPARSGQQTHPESPRRNEGQGAPRYQAPQYSPREQGRPAPQYQPRTEQYPNRGAQPQYQQRTQPYQQQFQNRGPQQPQYQPRTQPYPGQFQNRGSQPDYRQYGTPGNRPSGNDRPQFQRPPQNPYAPQSGGRGPQATPQSNLPAYGRQQYSGAVPGTAQQLYAPPGHLGSWLNNHKNTPVPQQQQMLRSDPSFRKLPQGEQQRVINELNQVNRLPDAQRERRLARAENLERL